jgi:hypothetical protein
LTEAFLHGILPSTRGPSRDRPARVLQTSGLPSEPSPTSASAEPMPPPHTMGASTSPTPAVTAAQAECMVLTEQLAAVDDQGFRGPLKYFGTNADPEKKKQNHAEFTRRRQHGLCFKCTPADVTAGSFRSCPRHGITAVHSSAALRARSIAPATRSRDGVGLPRPSPPHQYGRGGVGGGHRRVGDDHARLRGKRGKRVSRPCLRLAVAIDGEGAAAGGGGRNSPGATGVAAEDGGSGAAGGTGGVAAGGATTTAAAGGGRHGWSGRRPYGERWGCGGWRG